MKKKSIKKKNKIFTRPQKLIKGKSVFVLTLYGSYIDSDLDGMAAEKNAESYEALIKQGYKPYEDLK